MTTLHIINQAKSPSELSRLIQYCLPNDSLLFIQDGAYSLFSLSNTDINLATYVLLQDANARNIALPDTVKAIDFPQFVDLTLRCNKTISW